MVVNASDLIKSFLPTGPSGPVGPTGTGYWSQTGTSIYYSSGNVGIGTTGPTNPLTVVGNSSFDGVVDLKAYVETDTAPTISSNTLTLDLNSSTIFDVSLNSNINTLTLTNVTATSGKSVGFTLVFTADGTARTVSWPITFRWPGGNPPTLTSTLNKRDVFTFFTTDNGTSWNAFVSGQNL